MTNLFPDIVPGVTTGSVAASVLNALGRSDESAIKIVSGSDVLSTESGYYKEGTLVLAKDSGKFWLFSGGSFVDSGSVISTISGIAGSSVMSDTGGSVVKHNTSTITAGSYTQVQFDGFGHAVSGSMVVSGSSIGVVSGSDVLNIEIGYYKEGSLVLTLDTKSYYTLASGSWNRIGGLYPDYILIQDQKSQNTAGGTFTAGAWRTRDLNTEVSDAGGHASISSNQITLAAGTYDFLIFCPAYKVNIHQAILYNISDSAVIKTGTSMASGAAEFNVTHSIIAGRVVLAATKILEIQHWCTTTGTTTGFGPACNLTTEVFTSAEFRKVA